MNLTTSKNKLHNLYGTLPVQTNRYIRRSDHTHGSVYVYDQLNTQHKASSPV
jgi:hypothetical protein